MYIVAPPPYIIHEGSIYEKPGGGTEDQGRILRRGGVKNGVASESELPL